MAKNNSVPIRADRKLIEEVINPVLAKNLLRNKRVKTRRITLAIANQYKKYPKLLQELEEADLV